MNPVLWKMILLVLSIVNASLGVYSAFSGKYPLEVTYGLFMFTAVLFSLAMIVEIVDMIGMQIGAMLEGMIAAARLNAEHKNQDDGPEFPQE